MKNKDIGTVLSVGVSLNSENNMNALYEKASDALLKLTGSHTVVYYQKTGSRLTPKAAVCAEKKLSVSSFSAIGLKNGSVYEKALCGQEPVLIPGSQDSFSEEDLLPLSAITEITGLPYGTAILMPFRKPDAAADGLFLLLGNKDYQEDDFVAVRFLAVQTASAAKSLRYIKDTQLIFLSFVETMISAVETLTPYNANHTRNMVTYGVNFIMYLKNTPYALSEQAGKELVMSIWFHDIGKLCTPVDIMNKNTRLWPIQKAEIRHRMEVFGLKARLQKAEGKISEKDSEKILLQTEELLRFVEKADTCVVDDREEKLARFGALLFTDEGGTELPYLTEEEIHQLAVKYRTLTDEEFEIMRNHVVQTEKLLSSMYFPEEMPDVKGWASAHHELLNGKGYPGHLTAEQIPKEVRILTILDIFEALTARDRDYKKPMTPEEAIAHLHKIAGFGEVDETLVTLFEESRAWE